MALSFDEKLEAVKFGEREITPRPTVEARLRLQSVKFNSESSEELKKGIHQLAVCFPDDTEYVEEYITKNYEVVGLYKLQAYLMNGMQGLKFFDDENMQKAVEKTLGEANE